MLSVIVNIRYHLDWIEGEALFSEALFMGVSVKMFPEELTCGSV